MQKKQKILLIRPTKDVAVVLEKDHYHQHIRLINDLSTASITQHKTYTMVNGNKTNVITGEDTERC